MKRERRIQNESASLIVNAVYALGNCAVGFVTHSWWFVTVGAYYVVLTVARFSVRQVKRRSGGDAELELFAKKITGILFGSVPSTKCRKKAKVPKSL